MDNKPLRVACYARYSTSMQREESISAQLRAMKKFCADNGWKIVGKYVDEAYSATTDKRPQFQQMIADSNKREFDIVLVHKLDRFARNRYDSSLYKQKLRKNGVKLCSVLERLDSSPESILLEGLLESINEFYSANLARESMKGMKENAYKCLFNGGCPGLGYDIDESQHYVINEQEAKAVMLIFSMYLCDYSYQQIADALNADGFLTKIGKPFTRNSFIEILRNEKYTGVYIFNRSESKGYDNKRNSHRNKPPEEIIRIEGGIPAIISRETWAAAQKKRIAHMHRSRHCNCVYLLSKLVVCGVCHHSMNGAIRLRPTLPSYHTYTCGTKKADCDNPKEIEKNSLEEYVIELVRKKCLDYAEPSVKESFLALDRDSYEFRTLLQRFIDQVEVYPENVVVKLFVKGNVKSFRHNRRAFKTPSQRCFKDKK